MKKLFDVLCPNDHFTEAWLESDERETKCNQCGEVAIRQISAVRSTLDVVSGDFPGATAKWQRDRNVKIAKEQKTMRDHGTPK
jgi:hypothetical protein